jgi:hypothetical protein
MRRFVTILFCMVLPVLSLVTLTGCGDKADGLFSWHEDNENKPVLAQPAKPVSMD